MNISCKYNILYTISWTFPEQRIDSSIGKFCMYLQEFGMLQTFLIIYHLSFPPAAFICRLSNLIWQNFVLYGIL